MLGNVLLLSFLGMIAVYGLVAQFVPSRIMIMVGDAFSIPMSLAAFGVYFNEVWRRPGSERLTPVDIIMIGICGGWLTNALDRAVRLWARVHDATVLDEPVVGMFLFMLMYFAALHVHVRAGSASYNETSMRGKYIVGLALLIGALFSAVVVALEIHK